MSWPCSSDLDFFCQHSFTPGIPAIANNLQLPKPCAHFTPPHLGICRSLRLECSYRLPEHACKPPASPTPLLRDTAPASPLLSSFINHPLPSPHRTSHPSLHAQGTDMLGGPSGVSVCSRLRGKADPWGEGPALCSPAFPGTGLGSYQQSLDNG